MLDVGRRTRTVPTALQRALEGRDRNQCQFPGCNSRHCDAHHVVHWADGGEPLAPTAAGGGRREHRSADGYPGPVWRIAERDGGLDALWETPVVAARGGDP